MTRLAQPWQKLGYYFPSGLLLPTLFSCVLQDGGLVGTLHLKLVRKYQPIFLEKTADDGSVVRNLRAHERKLCQLEHKKELALQEVSSLSYFKCF